jgi:hypothetical protein
MDYQIQSRNDGGYTIYFKVKNTIQTKTVTYPAGEYRVELIGKGKDRSLSQLPGIYYSPESITSLTVNWGYGFAFLDNDRKFAYLNLYQITGPDTSEPLFLNGRYPLP